MPVLTNGIGYKMDRYLLIVGILATGFTDRAAIVMSIHHTILHILSEQSKARCRAKMQRGPTENEYLLRRKRCTRISLAPPPLQTCQPTDQPLNLLILKGSLWCSFVKSCQGFLSSHLKLNNTNEHHTSTQPHA